MNLRFRQVEVRLQNIVLRNALMFIDMTQQKLKKLGRIACVVEKNFMNILAILKEESFALMNVPILNKLWKKLGFANIVENYLKLTHLLLMFVVPGNVELVEVKQKIGLHEKKFFVNASNVVRNFGKSHQMLKNLVVSIVQKNVFTKRTRFQLEKLKINIFTLQLFGKNFVKKFLKEINIVAKNVVLVAMDCIFITWKQEEMVVKMQKIILLPYAIIAIE